MSWLSDFLTAFSVSFRTVRARGDSARRLREVLAELRIDNKQLRANLARAIQERDDAKREIDEKEAKLAVTKIEVEGVSRAHKELCEMLASRTAIHVAKTAKLESGGR